ncbi:acyl carrier protein [Paenibacillus wenxiniae]|uniref:Acyl carrier protein n=1 Tax=Paenibacillus wenxiniae TaxID=1636843 RepID=A0ABW4RNT4_9BACL
MNSLEQQTRNALSKIIDLTDNTAIDRNEDLLKYGLDSLATIKLILQLETEFKIEFTDEELLTENFNTIAKIIDRISNKVA